MHLMLIDIDPYIAFAEHQLTPQRFTHSLGVMQVMSELAPIYRAAVGADG